MKTFGISEAKSHWLVRLSHKDKMPQIQKAFHWGAKRTRIKAFFDAVDFRDKELKKLIEKGCYVIGAKQKPQNNNTSGILGVSRIENRNRQNKPLGTFMWSASFKDETGRAVTRTFSESKYGAKVAFYMACRERATGIDVDIDSIFILDNVKIPDWN